MKYILILAIQFVFVITSFNIKAQETGKASFYNKKFGGRKTQSGERLDNNKFTAAHKSLPFGTYVKVTNLKNNNWCIVKINDRGRFKKGRVIDVTQVAARELDMIRDGIAKVRIEKIPFNDTINIDTIKVIDSKPIQKQGIQIMDTLHIEIEH